MTTGRYYMSPEERSLYEQDKLLQTIANVGQQDPYYALGLALGRGLGNSYGNIADQRELERMDSNLATAPMVDEQGNFSPITEAQAKQRANDISVSKNNFAKSWNTYQEAIKEKAREHYVPRIGSLVENGALRTNAGIAQLSNELDNYSQYDPEGAKNVVSGIAALSKAVGVPKTIVANRGTAQKDNERAEGAKSDYKFNNLLSLRKQYEEGYNAAVAAENDTLMASYRDKIDKLDTLLDKTLYPQTPVFEEYPSADEESTPLTDPDAYETKTYEEYAKEALVKDIANLGRPAPEEGSKTEPAKKGTNVQGNTYVAQTQEDAFEKIYELNPNYFLQLAKKYNLNMDDAQKFLDKKKQSAQ